MPAVKVAHAPDRATASRFRIVRYLLPGLRAQPGRIGFATTCLVLSVVLSIVEPWPLQYVLDSIVTVRVPQPAVASPETLGGLPRQSIYLLPLCAVALVAIAALRALAEYYRTVSFSLVGNNLVTNLRGQLFRHVQTLSLRFHQQARGGDLTVRLTSDMNMLKEVAVTAALPLISSALMLVGMAAVMVYLNWQLGLLVLSILPPFWWLTVRASNRIHQSAKTQRRREGALAATAAESMAAVKSLQALSADTAFAGVFSEQNKKSNREGVRTSQLSAGLERTVDILIAIVSALVLWQGARLVLNDKLSPGELVVYLAYVKRGFKPLQDFAKYTARLAKAMAAGDRIVELLEQQPEVVDAPHARPARRFLGRIALDRVGFGYDREWPILNNLSLEIEPGERIAIVGQSGVGKSTVLSLLLRLYDPVDGRILVDGEDIRTWTLKSFRDQFSVVLQDNAIFATSVRENIALSRSDATLADVEVAARIALADEFIRDLPQGYDTILGERGLDLSHGQRQRLAIARAALRQAPILLLDEPTSSLDADNRLRVMSALHEVSANRTTLIVTHDMDLAAQSDRVLYLRGAGRIEFAPHAVLLQSCTPYAHLCRDSSVGRVVESTSHAVRC